MNQLLAVLYWGLFGKGESGIPCASGTQRENHPKLWGFEFWHPLRRTKRSNRRRNISYGLIKYVLAVHCNPLYAIYGIHQVEYHSEENPNLTKC